jgi:hypothetical protein
LDGKIRIETPDFSDGFFVSDSSNHVSYFPCQLFCTAKRPRFHGGTAIKLAGFDVRVGRSRRPCKRWRSMAKVAGAQGDERRCERDGQEIIDGRHAVHYRIIPSSDREMSGWVDPNLKFPLKIQKEDGTTALVANMKEGPQPASLFEIPTDFRKFDPEALIRRIEQSDMWVEEPRP